MNVLGLDKVNERLTQLDLKVRKQIARRALKAGAQIIRQSAMAQAPVRSGVLKSAIKVRAGKSRKGAISVIVGIGKKWFSGPTFYAAFVLWGHKIGSRKLGAKRKQYAGNDFLGRAYEATKGEVVETIKENLISGIEDAITNNSGG